MHCYLPSDRAIPSCRLLSNYETWKPVVVNVSLSSYDECYVHSNIPIPIRTRSQLEGLFWLVVSRMQGPPPKAAQDSNKFRGISHCWESNPGSRQRCYGFTKRPECTILMGIIRKMWDVFVYWWMHNKLYFLRMIFYTQFKICCL